MFKTLKRRWAGQGQDPETEAALAVIKGLNPQEKNLLRATAEESARHFVELVDCLVLLREARKYVHAHRTRTMVPGDSDAALLEDLEAFLRKHDAEAIDPAHQTKFKFHQHLQGVEDAGF